jgi:REP element-mobilizing transposase RayT
MDEADWEVHKQKLIFARFDAWIDRSPAARHLEQPELAMTVRNALYHFAGERYWLLAYSVMPSHYHWVFKPIPDWADTACREDQSRTPRERIMHSIQSFTANRCNNLLKRSGVFWQDETYDHCVRDDGELLRIIDYVERNPVKAELVKLPDQWVWSSAYDRARHWMDWGSPLVSKQ